MSRTEIDRDDPSDGKSGASPSAPGSGVKSTTVNADPDTEHPRAADKIPQVPPVPDVARALKEGRKPHH